jgi:hypothetical protein
MAPHPHACRKKKEPEPRGSPAPLSFASHQTSVVFDHDVDGFPSTQTNRSGQRGTERQRCVIGSSFSQRGNQQDFDAWIETWFLNCAVASAAAWGDLHNLTCSF